MNTLLTIASLFLLGLVIASKIPGLEYLVKPLIDLTFSFIKVIAENFTSWFIWLFKLLWQSHMELLQHLIFPAEAIDPSVEIRRKAEEG